MSIKSNMRMVGEKPMDSKLRREDFGARREQSSQMPFNSSEMNSGIGMTSTRNNLKSIYSFDEDYNTSTHEIIGERFRDDSAKDLN